jgi:hypothetical protein
LHEDIIPLPPAGRKTKGGIFLKLRINFHTGTTFLLEWEPMEGGRFYAIVGLVAVALMMGFFYGLVQL